MLSPCLSLFDSCASYNIHLILTILFVDDKLLKLVNFSQLNATARWLFSD